MVYMKVPRSRHSSFRPLHPLAVLGFVAPGLYKTERRAGRSYHCGTLFFIAGGAFGY